MAEEKVHEEAADSEPADEAGEEDGEDQEPTPDPETCKGIAVSMDVFWEGVESGEWLDEGYLFYIEPEGILNGPLYCSRSEERVGAGLLMTRDAWRTKTVFLDDDVNPEVYELSFPKEYGYIKSIQHYMESSREHAKYPWTKKY